MKYSLIIDRLCNGQTDRVCVTAEGRIDCSSARLTYCYDGAEYLLFVSEESIRQIRNGETHIFTEYRAGEETKCRVRCGASQGEFAVETRSLKVVLSDGAFEAECVFWDGSDEVRLELSAKENK